MSTAQFPDYSPHIVNGIHEVASHHIGKSLIGTIRSYFTGDKIRRGNYYLSRSRTMVAQHYSQLNFDDQDAVDQQFTKTFHVKERLETANGSIFKKYSIAKEYEEVTKELFIIVETASNRAADRNLRVQISRALAERATQPPPLGTTTALSNPFSDSHEASTLTDVDVANLDRVEMTIFESEARGDAVVVLGLHGRDATTQEAVATFTLEAVPGDRTDDADRATVKSFDTTNHGFYGTPSEAGGDVGQ